MAWLDGWGNNIFRFTIDHTKVDSNLTNFPLLVTLSGVTGANNDFDATNIFDELGPNKKKIAITTYDGSTQCPTEIEYWNATEEVAHLWTKVPTVYSTVDTTMYLYYDQNQNDNVDYIGEATDPMAQMVVDIGAEGTYDTTHVNYPAVIKDGDTYKMWYSGYGASPLYWWNLYCDSTNGTTWSNHQMVVGRGSEGTYDTTHAFVSSVIKDGSTYKMWYTGVAANYTIIYCNSMNGTTWSGFQMVVDIGDEGTYDATRSAYPHVIKDDTTYKMWYSGYDGSNWRIIYCTSVNGTTWANHQLVVNIGAEGTYDTLHVNHACVIKDGSTYKMWYTGHDGANFRIIYCDSTNGTAWSNHQMVVDKVFEGTYDTVHSIGAHVIKEDSVYKMWYGGNDGTNYRAIYTKSYDGIHWGNASCGVWDSNYTAVYHMNQDPSGGSGAIKDSTYNINHGTSAGTMAANDLVKGVVDGSIDFDGVDDYINYGSDSSLDDIDVQTVEFTFKADTWGSWNGGRIIQKANVNANGWNVYTAGSNNSLGYMRGWSTNDGLWNTPDNSISLSTWYTGAIVYDRTSISNDPIMYINGVSVSGTETWTPVGTIETDAAQDMWAGARKNVTSDREFDGIIDEIRVSDVDRSPAWVRAIYYSNENNLLSFDPLSYLEGQCTDRYGVPMDVVCNVVALDDVNYSVLGYGSTTSGTGRFSIRVYGKEAGSNVLVAYGFPGDYLNSSYPAGAEYMSTISGTTLSGGGY